MVEDGKNSSDIPAADMYELRKLQILQEMENELWAWAKRKGWVFLLTLAVVGAGGVWLAIDRAVKGVAERPLEDFRTKLVDMQVQTELARRAGITASSLADQVVNQLRTTQGTIAELEKQAGAVGQQFKVVIAQIDASAKNAALRSDNDFRALQGRITQLEALVRKIADENESARKAAADYDRKLSAFQSQLEKEQRRFAENAKYNVTVFYPLSKRDVAQQAQARLAAAGFRTSLVVETPFFGLKTSDPYRGSTVLFSLEGEAKAQEAIALLKPLLKEIRAIKFTPDPSALLSWGPKSVLELDPTSISVNLASD